SGSITTRSSPSRRRSFSMASMKPSHWSIVGRVANGEQKKLCRPSMGSLRQRSCQLASLSSDRTATLLGLTARPASWSPCPIRASRMETSVVLPDFHWQGNLAGANVTVPLPRAGYDGASNQFGGAQPPGEELLRMVTGEGLGWLVVVLELAA